MVCCTNSCQKKNLKNHGNPSVTCPNTLLSFRNPNQLVFLRHFVISKLLQMHMRHKTYRHCSHAWLEDVCKVLRHTSYCKWAIEGTMVWHTPANKTPVIGHGNILRYIRLWHVSLRPDAGVSNDKLVCHHPISQKIFVLNYNRLF